MDQKSRDIKVSERHCLSCGYPISLDHRHCPNCGQKTAAPRFSVWELISEFFNNIFQLENKIFQSIFGLFVPARLTYRYMAGERTRYYHPVRILLVTLILYFGLLAREVNNTVPDIAKDQIDSYRTIVLDEARLRIDSVKSFYFSPDQYEALQCLEEDALGYSDEDEYFADGMNVLGLDFSEIKIPYDDLYKLSVNELLEKYEIMGFTQQLAFTQIIRVYINRTRLPAFIIGNLIWAIVIVLLFAAIVMKLLYIRRKYFYAEHLVFLIHVHALGFLLGAILLIRKWILDHWYGRSDPIVDTSEGFELLNDNLANVVMISMFLFFFFALLRYYRQGIFKSIAKMIIFAMSYMLILLFIGLLISFASLLFF